MDQNNAEKQSKSTRPDDLLRQKMLQSALYLALFTLAGISFLLITQYITADPIKKAEKQVLLKTIDQILPKTQYNNDLFTDTISVTDPKHLGTDEPVTIYRARLNQKPVAVIMKVIATEGYSGKIHIITGIYQDGTLAGVRVLKHRETPGLGDKVEIRKTDWILGFNGEKLRPDQQYYWRVKKDGGHFDQFTGATITPRAIVKAVKNALHFVQQQGDRLYESAQPAK